MIQIEDNYNKIYTHQLLNKIIDDLTYNQFFQELKTSQATLKIEFEDLKKCIWLCSILANSPNEDHRKFVQLFASLTYLQNIENIDIERACYLLCSRVGNLTATRLFKNFSDIQEKEAYNFDAILDLEMAVEWDDKLIITDDSSVLTSNFQKELWNKLNSGERLAISAPTSAGKSFILKKYVHKRLNQNEEFKILYIVPSKALINQVSEEFRKEVNLNEVDVKTAFIEEDEKGLHKKKEIYVLTAERSLRLIQNALKDEIKIDLVFIDEIQNIEDEEGRGSLLEYVLKELFLLFNKAQFIIAGPNISNSSSLFKKIFDIDSISAETGVSPVFQIKTVIRPSDDNHIKITLKNSLKREQSFTLKTDINFQKKMKINYGEGIAPVIDFFSTDDQNIIYSPRTDYVEDWALTYIDKSINISTVEDVETNELIEFLKEEIHPKYNLIKCLEKKVAFHHSKLPDIVRKEIEDGFLEKRIRNLFCTSTLLEGVNLPANNLFIASAKKLSDELTPFEFGNLIGRAGRIKDCLYGTIYCIERTIDETWAEEYYDKIYLKEVQSVSEKSLMEFDELARNLDKPISEIKDAKHLNTTISLRHKFLSDPNILDEYLAKKDIDENKIKLISSKLTPLLADISIPTEIRKLNPSIDPILQNQLYMQILEEGIENWAITPNENFHRGVKKENNDNIPFEKKNLYWQLVSIMERLDLIFNISREAYFKHNISASINQICFYGLRWLDNISYNELIKSDIDFYSNHQNPSKKIDPEDEDAINKIINNVIKINSTLVSYVLVKYFKVANDIMEPIMTEEQKEKYKFSLSLPTMLELGSSESVVKLLISRGVSRSVAIKVWGEFKNVKGYEDLDVFEWLKTKEKLNLKPIYNRYLERQKLLKIN